MKVNPSSRWFIVGKGWKVGPLDAYNRHEVITRVIEILVWSARTRKARP